MWKHEMVAYKMITSCQVFVKSNIQQSPNILCFSKFSVFQNIRALKITWLFESFGFVKFFKFVKYYMLPRDFRSRLSHFIAKFFEIIKIIKLPIIYELLYFSIYRINFKAQILIKVYKGI